MTEQTISAASATGTSMTAELGSAFIAHPYLATIFLLVMGWLLRELVVFYLGTGAIASELKRIADALEAIRKERKSL